MNIDILCLFPEMLNSIFSCSILKRAQEKGIVKINLYNIRDYSTYKHKQVDDYPYGGGAGMVLMPEPVANCIDELKKKHSYDEIIYLTADGEKLNQKMANYYSTKKSIMLLCGHYKGVDQRIRDIYVSKEISIGDYVLTGGELAAAVLVDSIVRLIPGVLNDGSSALSDSFQDNILEAPIYTRPKNFKGHKVPDILLSGNHKLISNWRYSKALEKTRKLRPDLNKD